MNKKAEGVSVLMPTYNQGSFISRAISSLLLQTYQPWELIIINDGSTDYTGDVVKEYLHDKRIRHLKNQHNLGLGESLNIGLSSAQYNLITYLPSDDIYYQDHLEALYRKIQESPNAILAYSGINFNYTDTPRQSFCKNTFDKVNDMFQLIQVMHKKTHDKWTERKELVTDDLDKMFWAKLADKGDFIPTMKITAEWVNHPEQRSALIREDNGGIYTYKQYYQVKEPIRFHSTVGNFIDEIQLYKQFRGKKHVKSPEKLKIVLVGELAYNPERVCAFEERGHQLFGLWINSATHYNAAGNFAFGNIKNIPFENWEKEIRKIKPDIIYALLNYSAVPLAHYVLKNKGDIPFVWHFKESPFYCRQMGVWKELMELYVNSDEQIYINEEIRKWFNQFIDPDGPAFILDGDLPKSNWFYDHPSPKLSDKDGEIHTVMPGRPIGISAADMQILADNKIHFHFYGNFLQGFYTDWLMAATKIDRKYLHLHSYCDQSNWVKEFSQYDAGWLHCFDSKNEGELMKANWDDLNYPVRMSLYAMAGLPMIQKNNNGHLVAAQLLTKRLEAGIFFNSYEDLACQLNDKPKLRHLQENIWNKRKIFSFDHHVDALTDFFREVINHKRDISQAASSAFAPRQAQEQLLER